MFEAAKGLRAQLWLYVGVQKQRLQGIPNGTVRCGFGTPFRAPDLRQGRHRRTALEAHPPQPRRTSQNVHDGSGAAADFPAPLSDERYLGQVCGSMGTQGPPGGVGGLLVVGCFGVVGAGVGEGVVVSLGAGRRRPLPQLKCAGERGCPAPHLGHDLMKDAIVIKYMCRKLRTV
jgi:hypothetical protein